MNGDFGLIWAVLALPILGFLIQAFLGKKLAETAGTRLVGALAVLPILVAFGIAAKLTMDLSSLDAAQRSVIVQGPSWIEVSTLKLPFEWLIDPLSMTMVLIITGIGGLIHLYATGYMAKEKEYARFFTYLNLFIASMLILVLGNNLGLLFMGWEGVGLCSYLLIGFWYKDQANAKAANKAFIVNRIGDWGLSIGLFLIFAVLVSQNAPGMVHFGGGSLKIEGTRFLSYDVMLPALKHVLELNPALATTIALLLFVGAAGKSAQFPLYMWLPDAMAGPTPVSALIHAATMVTSGVVLLNRMHVVFELSAVASAVVVVVGAFTALFAAVIAFGQTDIKKVLAFSTVSQLGFMFVGCGAGAYWTGMFHVTTHAFFKALLFLGAGAVIHAMAHNQDMRNYGNLKKYLPITTITMVIGWLAIAAVAIPMGEQIYGFSGAYSKESILASAIGGDFTVVNGVVISMFAGWISLFTALLTSIYMTRMMFLTFFGKQERWRDIPAHAETHGEEEHVLAHEPTESLEVLPASFYLAEAAPEVHEEHHELDQSHTPREVPVSMWLPLVILAALSAGGGFLMAKGNVFENWLASGPLLATPASVNEVPNLALFSAAAAFGGIILGAFFYRKGLPTSQGWDETKWAPWRKDARNQFGFDNALSLNATEGGADLARGIWKIFDAGFVDGIVNGAGSGSAWIGGILRKAQSGYVRLYALVMLFGGVAFLGYFIFAMRQIGGSK